MRDEVRAADASQFALDVAPLFGLIPEEELALGEFLALCLGAEDGLEGIRVEACVPGLCGHSHGRGREVLHLLEVEVEALGDDGELGHIGLFASRVGTDEIGDDLLAEVLFAVDAVEDALELFEELERGFAHVHEDAVGGVLGCHFQSAADVLADELAGVGPGGLVDLLVGAAVEQQVVAHAAANETLLDAGQGVNGVVDVEQGCVVGVEVGTDGGMDARGAPAALTCLEVAAAHAVHIGRGSAEVGEVAFEVGQLGHLPDLAEDALLGAAGDELALMGGDGAEGAPAEASAMDVDGVTYHLVGGYALVLVFRVRQARVGQVEGGVELLGGHGGIGRIDDGIDIAHTLQEALCVHLVGLLFDVAEVLGFGTFGAQALLVGVEHDVVGRDATGDVALACEEDGLGEVVDGLHGDALVELFGNAHDGLLAHTVADDVGSGIAEDTAAQGVLPVVVVGEPAERCLDASQHDGHIGEELPQDAAVDDGGVFRPAVVAPVGAIGILRAQAAVGGVFVDHRVHTSRRDAEEEARAAKLLEVAEVAVPVGLRHDGHAIAVSLEHTPDDGHPERRMVHIGIAREEDDVERVPSPQFQLFLGGGQEVGEWMDGG